MFLYLYSLENSIIDTCMSSVHLSTYAFTLLCTHGWESIAMQWNSADVSWWYKCALCIHFHVNYAQPLCPNVELGAFWCCHQRHSELLLYLRVWEPGSEWVSLVVILHKPKGPKMGSKSVAGSSSECESDKVGTRAGGKLVKKILGTMTNHLTVTMADCHQLSYTAL